MGKRVLIAALVGGVAAALAVMVAMALNLGPTAEKLLPAICAGLGAAFAVQLRRKSPASSPADPSRRAQTVGAPCAACGKKIAFEADATRCSKCDVPLHAKCSAGHACPEKAPGA